MGVTLTVWSGPWGRLGPGDSGLVCFVVAVWSLSHVRLFVTLWTAAHQTLVSMGFSRLEYESGLPSPPPWGLPDPGMALASPALAGSLITAEPPGKPRPVV